jgi:hypothetical protein
MALVQIRDHHPGEFSILFDSISSLRALQTRKISPRTHSLVYEIKQASWWVWDSYYVDSVSCKCDRQQTSGPFGRRGSSRRYGVCCSCPISAKSENVGRFGSMAGARVGWVDIPIRFCFWSNKYLGLSVLIATDVLSSR